jgi:hypothetical protein
MPTAGPADGVDNRDVGAVAADKLRSQPAGLFEHGVFVGCCSRFFQPPVQMHFRLDLAGVWVRPLAAGLNSNGRRAEDGFKRLPGLLRELVAFDAKGDTFADVVGLRVLMVLKCCYRRTEHGRFMPRGCLSGADDSDVQKIGIADPDRLDADRLVLFASFVGKQAQRNNSITAGVLEHNAGEPAQRFAIRFEFLSLFRVKRVRTASLGDRHVGGANAGLPRVQRRGRSGRVHDHASHDLQSCRIALMQYRVCTQAEGSL